MLEGVYSSCILKEILHIAHNVMETSQYLIMFSVELNHTTEISVVHLSCWK